MKYKPGLLILLFILCRSGASAQVIVADKTSGCDSLIVNFRLEPSVSTGTSVLWNFGNGTTASGNATPVVLYSLPGKYTVTCTLNNALTITSTDLIKVNKTPSAQFAVNDSLAAGPLTYVFHRLSSPGDTVVNLSWQISDGTVGSSERIVHTFAETGEYSALLIASSATGCADTTSRKIEVSELMKAPNVFTPNDDAINDYFTVRTDGINVYTLSVYTRSGVLIYRSQSPDVSWDGRSFAGEPVTPGIYYYIIQRSDIGSKELKGIVYLLR